MKKHLIIFSLLFLSGCQVHGMNSTSDSRNIQPVTKQSSPSGAVNTPKISNSSSSNASESQTKGFAIQEPFAFLQKVELAPLDPKPVEAFKSYATAGSANYELTPESFDPTLRIDVISSKQLERDLPMTVTFPSLESAPAKFWATDAQGGDFKAIYLASQKIPFDEINDVLDDFLVKKAKGNFDSTQLTPLLDFLSPYEINAMAYFEKNQDKVHSATYFSPLRPEKSKSKMIKDLNIQVGEETYPVKGLNINTGKKEERLILNQTEMEEDATTVPGLRLIPNEEGTFLISSPVENRFTPIYDVTLQGVRFQNENFKLKKMVGTLKKGDKALWTKEYKPGDQWKIPGNHSLEVAYEIEAPSLKNNSLPQTHLIINMDFQKDANKKEFVTQFILAGHYFESPLGIHLIQRDGLDLSKSSQMLYKITKLLEK